MKALSFPWKLLVLTAMFIGCGPKKSDIELLTAEEVYPFDTVLSSIKNKKAMVVTAHDDDCSAMAGTLAKLNNEGWHIKQICFVSESPERDSALLTAASFILDELEFIKITPETRRPGIDSTVIPYMPVPKETIRSIFKYQEIATEIIEKINEFQPAVIFSLDNIMGGYGHPEHLLVSQLVIDSSISGAITPQYIYQSVYPNSMERKILKERLGELAKKWGFPNSYQVASNMYSLDGMPEPDVQITISSFSEPKMNFLRSFSDRERKTIGFYVPMFQDFDYKEYFEVFDREFFRVIKKQD